MYKAIGASGLQEVSSSSPLEAHPKALNNKILSANLYFDTPFTSFEVEH